MHLARLDRVAAQRSRGQARVPRGKYGALLRVAGQTMIHTGGVGAERRAAIAMQRLRMGAGDVNPLGQGAQGVAIDGSAATDTATTTGGSLTGGTTATASLPAANTAVYSSTSVIVTGTPGVNLRASASTAGQILAGEPTGTVLSVLGNDGNGWLNVTDPSGRQGWVYSAYVADASASTPLAASTGSSPSATGVGAGIANVAAAPSQSPSILGDTGSGLLLVAVVGGLTWAAYKLL